MNIFKKILCIFFIASSIAFADEAEDKAEFKRLYAEFNELYANSEELDPIIEVAEKLYKLAPKIYGNNHHNTAVVTYNLASLYDEKGEESKTKDEEKALDLYEDYFEVTDHLKHPQNQSYFDQYLQHLITAQNVNSKKLTRRQIRKLEDIQNNLEISQEQKANNNYHVALIYTKTRNYSRAVSKLEEIIRIYQNSAEPDYLKITETEYNIAIIELNENNLNNAEDHLLSLINNYENQNIPLDDRYKNANLNLARIYFSKRANRRFNKYLNNFMQFDYPQYIQIMEKEEGYLPIKRVNPFYPSKAIKERLEGFVMLNFDIDEEGKTINVKSIVSSNEIFEPYAERAVRGYQYNPTIVSHEVTIIEDLYILLEFRLSN